MRQLTMSRHELRHGKADSAGRAATRLLMCAVLASPSSAQTELARLEADDASGGARFGSALDIDGPLAVVGASGLNHPFNAGAAYVFSETGSGWVQVAKLQASDGLARMIHEALGEMVQIPVRLRFRDRGPRSRP